MEIQWYPGQMAKAKRLLRENIKQVDVVLEVLDARIPASSRNPDIQEIMAGKPVIAVLTRSDMADKTTTSTWVKVLHQDYQGVLAVNAKSGQGVKRLPSLLAQLPKKVKQRPVRLMVVGIPNVGKSSLINRLIGRSSATTGAKPGITRGKQWLRIKEGLEILDTPGLLWPKIATEKQAFGLAAVGAVKDEIVDPVQLAMELVSFFLEHAPGRLKERYQGLEEQRECRTIISAIGRLRGCLVPGGEVDMETASRVLIKDFREGRLGRISLEKAEERDKDEAKGFCNNDGGSDQPLPE